MAILTRFQLHKTLGCSEAVMQNWLTLIEANYKRNNAYHNSTHAADVLHATAFFLEQETVKEMCDGVDEATCLLAGKYFHTFFFLKKSSNDCATYFSLTYIGCYARNMFL